MPNPRLRFEPEFRRFRPRICGCFTGGVRVFSARGRKLVGPSRILAAKVLKFGNRDFEGPGEKYPGNSGCRKPQFAGVGKKPWKLMERHVRVSGKRQRLHDRSISWGAHFKKLVL